MQQGWQSFIKRYFPLSIRDLACTGLILSAAMYVCTLIRIFDTSNVYVSLIYVLAVFLVARFTHGYLYGLLASGIGVLMVNYLFTYPLFAFNFSLPGYPVTVVCSLFVSIVTSTMTTRMMESHAVMLEAEKEKMRSNLLRAVSHDLRTPLTAILGASSTILENDDTLTKAERTRLLYSIKDDTQWLIAIMENLLSVTRIESDGACLHKIPVPVEEVVASAVAKFKKRFPAYTVRASIPNEVLMPPMDPLLIEQVLLNLLENTVFHAPEASQRCVQVTQQGEQVVFQVCDNGNGIARDVLARLRGGHAVGAKRTTTHSDSRRHMGIGLSVCNSIIKAHGGSMNAQNAATGGAIFSFTLPLEQEE